MTACVNRKHTKKVAAVVTASLVGALSLGVAPVAAMAEEAGIDLLALDPATALQKGTMTEAEDESGRSLDIPADGIITVEAGKWVVPTEITPKDADPIEVIDWVNSGEDADVQTATVTYTAPDNTQKTNGNVSKSDFMTPGVYGIKVEMKKGDYKGFTFETTFIVEAPADLANATVFDACNNDVTDTTFTYKGKAHTVGIAVDGKALESNVDYKAKYYSRDDTTGALTKVADVKNAGTYVVNVFEADDMVMDSTTIKKQITFTVGKLDLTTADVSVADVVDDTNPTTISAVTKVLVDGDEFNVADGKSDTLSAVCTLPTNTTGKASVVVSAGANENVEGTATVEFNIVDEVLGLASAHYNGYAFNSSAYPADSEGVNTEQVNLADGESFKPERIEVFDAANKKLDSSYFTVSYKDSEWNDVEVSALANPGVYYVVVRVNAEASHFQYGSGDITLKVNVKSAEITDGNDIVFRYDGKVGDSFEKEYDGADFMDELETVVHTKWGDDLVEGTDYTVQAYNEDDEKVDGIVNAGKYYVMIELNGNYGGITDDDLRCDVEVTPKQLPYGLYVNGGDLTAYTYDEDASVPSWWPFPVPTTTTTIWYLGYTGEELEPAFELGYWTDKDGDVVEYDPAIASKLTWNAMPEGTVTVTGYRFDGKLVEAPKDKGEYVVEFALESGNYEIKPAAGSDVEKDTSTNVVTVTDANVAFADVDASKWYASSVFQAKQIGYVSGISGSNLFAPENSITRADALVIISRMSGIDQSVSAEDYLSENSGYLTRYSDVDAGAYYAKAVAWGTKVGIVHGDSGADAFRPQDAVTREEFAAMLSNYAKAMGEDTTADADAVLAEFPAGSAVSEWAEGAVAWAAASEVMGNGGVLNPAGQITRAEVAAMAVNYQPEGVSADVIG